MKKLILTAIAMSMTACLGGGPGDPVLDAIDKGQKFGDGDVPACQINYEEYEVSAHVLAFELTDRIEGKLGFNQLGPIKALHGEMKIEKSVMNMTMGLSEILTPDEPLSYVTGSGKGKKSEFKIGIDLGLLSLGGSYYKQTPLFKVSERAIRDSLSKVKKDVEDQKLVWKARVVLAKETEQGEVIYIPVGSASGIRPGDRFYVYNVIYDWEGIPCVSRLHGARKETAEPLAELEAYDVSANSSQMRLVAKNGEDAIRAGARVEISHLPKWDKKEVRALKRPVRVSSVKSQPLPIENHGSLDIRIYVIEQVKAFMDEYGFQPRGI